MYNCAVARASIDTLRKVPLFLGLDNKELGVAEIFTPGVPTSEIVDFLRQKVPS